MRKKGKKTDKNLFDKTFNYLSRNHFKKVVALTNEFNSPEELRQFANMCNGKGDYPIHKTIFADPELFKPLLLATSSKIVLNGELPLISIFVKNCDYGGSKGKYRANL